MTLNSFSSTFFLFCGKLFDLFTTSSKIYEIKWYKFSVYQFCYVYLNSSCNLHRWRLEQYCSGCHHHHSRIQVTAWSSSWLRTARACRHSRPRPPPPAALQCRPSCWWGLRAARNSCVSSSGTVIRALSHTVIFLKKRHFFENLIFIKMLSNQKYSILVHQKYFLLSKSK